MTQKIKKFLNIIYFVLVLAAALGGNRHTRHVVDGSMYIKKKFNEQIYPVPVYCNRRTSGRALSIAIQNAVYNIIIRVYLGRDNIGQYVVIWSHDVRASQCLRKSGGIFRRRANVGFAAATLARDQVAASTASAAASAAAAVVIIILQRPARVSETVSHRLGAPLTCVLADGHARAISNAVGATTGEKR